jgi:hypothetical protein
LVGGTSAAAGVAVADCSAAALPEGVTAAAPAVDSFDFDSPVVGLAADFGDGDQAFRRT